MAAAAILVFEKLEILTILSQSAPTRQISSKSIKRLLRYGDLKVFFKWRTAAFLGMSRVYWDHPQRLLGGLCRCAQFGWNRCSTFDNMKVLIFYAFGLKTHVHAPKIGVLGGFDSLSREQYQCDYQKALTVAKSRRLSH